MTDRAGASMWPRSGDRGIEDMTVETKHDKELQCGRNRFIAECACRMVNRLYPVSLQCGRDRVIAECSITSPDMMSCTSFNVAAIG